jgi:hypothetical protein
MPAVLDELTRRNKSRWLCRIQALPSQDAALQQNSSQALPIRLVQTMLRSLGSAAVDEHTRDAGPAVEGRRRHA